MKRAVSVTPFCLAFLLSIGVIRSALQKPQGNPSFEEKVLNARKSEGLFNLYRKEDNLYLEIQPEQFGKQYLLMPTLWTSTRFDTAGTHLPTRVFVWEKLDDKVLLLWKNTRYTAEESPHYKRSIENVIPDSIVHAFKIESSPHPERKSSLISLDDCFLSDLPALGQSLSRDPKHPYSVDKNRTVWGRVQSFPKNVELEVRYVVASARPTNELIVPDSRAVTVHVRYSISEVPMNNGYHPRLADDRIGFVHTKVYDFDRSGLEGTTVRYIHRWQLEKKNPTEEISEPKAPIVFWLENTIPLEYRRPLRDGVLEWNKAFERAGFKNAIVVKQMPDDAEWDPADVRYNTIRWVVALSGTGGLGLGWSRENPLTGQILDADVVLLSPLDYIFAHHAYRSPLRLDGLGEVSESSSDETSSWYQDSLFLRYERDFGILNMLVSGTIGDIEDVPEEYVNQLLKFWVCHEVGHTLGLRHNFKGSTTIALEDLHNTEVTARESIGNTVMEILPTNLAPKGVKQGDYLPSTIGAWDYWVIQYGYLPIEAKTPDDERAELEKIASRSTEPGLSYGASEDAWDLGPYATSIDPMCNSGDLSDDPIGYVEQEIARVEDLWQQLEDRALFEGESFAYLRRGFENTLRRYLSGMSRLTKWIGGIYHVRAHVGDPGGILPYRVVEYEKQKRALNIINEKLFHPDGFTFEPDFIRKLQIDRFMDFAPREDIERQVSQGELRLDFSLAFYLRRSYQRILNLLYDPARLHRIQDNELRTKERKLTLEDYLSELHTAIWEELETGEAIGSYRRILQREYLNTVTRNILEPAPLASADALAICRHQLKQLDKNIADYLSRDPDVDLPTRSHLDSCSDIINETLKVRSRDIR
jgi:hypothetical protein